jgi:hypothetical protein
VKAKKITVPSKVKLIVARLGVNGAAEALGTTASTVERWRKKLRVPTPTAEKAIGVLYATLAPPSEPSSPPPPLPPPMAHATGESPGERAARQVDRLEASLAAGGLTHRERLDLERTLALALRALNHIKRTELADEPPIDEASYEQLLGEALVAVARELGAEVAPLLDAIDGPLVTKLRTDHPDASRVLSQLRVWTHNPAWLATRVAHVVGRRGDA